MAWTNPAAHIFATGEVVTASTMNTYVQANLTFLGVGYGADIYQANAQSIPNNAATVIAFDTVEDDPNGMATLGSGAGIRVPTAAGGKYVVTGNVQMSTAISAAAIPEILRNAAEMRRGSQTNASGSGWVAMAIRKLAAADYIQLAFYQNSGGAINTTPGEALTSLSVHLIGPN